MTVTWSSITRGILLFWAVWFAVATLTNAADLLLAAGVLPAGWPLASGNYQLIANVTGRYPRPDWLVPFLITGVVVWEGAASVLFARAFASWQKGDAARRLPQVRLAYAVGLALWATFLVLDEFFIAYELEGTHLRLLIAHLACAAAAHLTPQLT